MARVTSDIETLAQFFQWGGLAWLLDGTLMVIVAAVMLAFNWQLALVAFVVSLPLMFVLRAVQSRLLRRLRRGPARATARCSARSPRSCRAPRRSARTAPAEDARTQVARGGRGEDRRADQGVARLGAFLFPSGEVFSALTIARGGRASACGWGRPSGLTAGALVGFIFLTYRFLEPIAEFTEVLDRPRYAVAGLRRVLSVLDMPVGPPPPDDPIPLPAGTAADRRPRRHVRLSGAATDRVRPTPPCSSTSTSRSRPGSRWHWSARPGRARRRSVASSPGSPTRRSARSISAASRCVGSAGPSCAPARSWCRRSRSSSTTSIAANVAFAVGARRRRTTSNASSTTSACSDWVDSLSDGLATKVGERGDQLSAGERQLVALLRAGLAGPDVLILDEATSSVDALTEVRVARALERLAASRTTIAIAHRLSTAARADRVLVLEHGRLVEDGHHDELIAADGPTAGCTTPGCRRRPSDELVHAAVARRTSVAVSRRRGRTEAGR